MEYIPSQLAEIDAVEIVDLSGVESDRVEQFMQESLSARSVKVTSESAQQIANLWRNLPSSEQMRCHNPPFGLRFFKANQLLVEGSICWECNNIFVNEEGASKTFEFDAENQNSRKLFEICQKAFD